MAHALSVQRLGWALLALSLALRLALAVWMPLGTDEAYAITVGRSFSPSFFDHPPAGFWLPGLSALLTGAEGPLVWRLGFVLAGSVTGWALWRIGAEVGGPRAGLATLVLWLVAPHMVLGSGLMAVPDAPLNMGLALATLVMVRALRQPGPRAPFGVFALWGLCAALALASKYQAALYLAAMLVFLLATPRLRGWAAQPAPWLGAAIALLGFVPVLVWNLQTDFASFRFHAGRTGGGLAVENLATMLAGQALYLLPPVMLLAALAVWRGWRGALAARMLAVLAGVQIVAFHGVYAFGTDTLPHWTMSGWMLALPLAGDWLARSAARGRWRWGIAAFAGPVWGLIAVLIWHATTGALTAGLSPAPEWDRQTELVSLDALPAALAQGDWLEGAQGVLADDWLPAGQIGAGLRLALPVQVAGEDRRHFAFLSPVHGAVLHITLSHVDDATEAPPPLPASLASATVERTGAVTLPRHGAPHLHLWLRRLTLP